MSIKDLKRAIMAKLGVTRQAVEARVKRKKKKLPMVDTEAYGVVAHEIGLDISKYLDPSDVKQVGESVYRLKLLGSPEARKRATSPAKTVFNIGPDFCLKDPLLPRRTLNDAETMTYVYAKLYVFENSVREVIKRVLCKKYGRAWWDGCISGKIKDKASVRMKDDDRNAWHGRRGNHPIYYVDMCDLGRTIAARWTQDFKGLFPSLGWVEMRINEISRSRNTVDHHNPLRPKDRKLIELYFAHWFDQIESVKDQLPDCGTLPPPATRLPG